MFEEAIKILPHSDEDEITTDHMAKHLNYSRAVLKETFRMNPVSVGVGRTTNTDLILSGYNVPKGVSYSNSLEFLPLFWIRRWNGTKLFSNHLWGNGRFFIACRQ